MLGKGSWPGGVAVVVIAGTDEESGAEKEDALGGSAELEASEDEAREVAWDDMTGSGVSDGTSADDDASEDGMMEIKEA